MKIRRCRFLAMMFFLGLICHCVVAESSVVEESGGTPDATWVMRIEADLAKRHSLLREMFAEGAFVIEMDYFKMGRYMNFFMTVGVTSNKIGMAVQRNVGPNITNNFAVVTTNMSVNVPEGALLDLRDGLRKYRYHHHAGHNAGWVRISTAENATDVVRWFDRPGWPQQEDREILRSPIFARRTENEEVWRRFFGVYRAIDPTVNEFLKALDRKPL